MLEVWSPFVASGGLAYYCIAVAGLLLRLELVKTSADSVPPQRGA